MKSARFACAFLSLASSLLAARAPGWLQEALKADTTEWSRTSSTAVLLSWESVEYLGPDRTRRRVREATRVMRDAGRDRALAALYYNADTQKVRSARAWVISPDGKTIDLYERPQFIDAAASPSRYFWNAQRIIAFPGGEKLGVGSVLACEFEVEAASSIFDSSYLFRSSDPVVRSVFEVAPAAGTKLEWHASSSQIPAPTTGSTPGSLLWEMRRIVTPAADMPSGYQANPWRVSVRCLPNAGSGSTRTWSGLARLITDVIEPRVVIDTKVKELGQNLTAGRTARWERVRAITAFVQREIPYLSLTLEKDTLAGYRPHTPADVLERRLGDCKDKATLVAALLRSIGDNGYLVLVHSQNPQALSPDWPSAYFNHAIVGIPADGDTPAHWPMIDAGKLGKLVLFDATDPATPLGILPPVDQGGYGLVVAADGAELPRLPVVTPERNARRRESKAVLAADAKLAATTVESYEGSFAATEHEARFELRDDDFGRRLDKRLAQTVPFASRSLWKDHWDPVAGTYRLEYEFNSERYGRWVGRDMLLVCPRLFESYFPLPAWQIAHEGIAWLVPERLEEQVRLELPTGFDVAEVPKPWTFDDALFSCRIAYRLEGRDLVYESTVVRKTGVLQRAQYDALRLDYQKLAEAERRPLVLKRAKPAS